MLYGSQHRLGDGQEQPGAGGDAVKTARADQDPGRGERPAVAVAPGEHQFRRIAGAVDGHEQLRSEVASKTTLTARIPQSGAAAALAVLGLSGASCHESFHTCGPYVAAILLPCVTSVTARRPRPTVDPAAKAGSAAGPARLSALIHGLESPTVRLVP